MSEAYQIDIKKEKKITDHVIAHQLIIMENTALKPIEVIKIREFQDKMDKNEMTIKTVDNGSTQPTNIIKPSSLNYKISLREAVNDYAKKELPCTEGQFIDVQEEEPKSSGDSSKPKVASINTIGEAYEEYDDIMFEMTVLTKKTDKGQKQ